MITNNSFKINPMIATDSYKLGHKSMYPEGTTLVYSNMTPRSGKIIERIVPASVYDGKFVNFGLQGLLKHYDGLWQENFFNKPLSEAIDHFTNTVLPFIGAMRLDVEGVVALHKLGYLPLEVKALPEGSVVPYKVPVFTVKNTLPEFYWLTNYTETYFSNEFWKVSTTATIARYYRKLLEKYAIETGCPSLDFVDFQAHDFSCRGMSGMHDAATAGSGHLLYFKGTDTLVATDFIKYAYPPVNYQELIGCSVPASEHSVMTSEGIEGEFELFKRIITEVVPDGIVSLVSDSFDYWKVITEYSKELKDVILARGEDPVTGLSKVVFRPDCYDDQTEILTDRGFKKFSDLTTDDLVAQVLDDGSYEFVKPSKYTVQDYSGEMIKFSDQKGKVDLLVTPNHRMVVEVNGKEKIILAEKMTMNGHDYQKMARSAKQKGSLKSLSNIERLMIAFQADGSFVTNSSKKIRFSFKKNRKKERLVEILKTLGFKYSIYNLKDGRCEYHIEHEANVFQKNMDWVDTKNISYEYARDFIEELSYWDATRRSESRFKFDTTNESVAKVVELVALAAGFGVLVSKRCDNRKDIFSDVYTVHVMKNNKIGGKSWKKEVVNYSGSVYCVKVPSGKLIVKRNRSVLVCGNSGDPFDIVCGNPLSETEAERKGTVECLWDIFGGEVNQKGYKVLNPKVGVIYGDSITLERAEAILEGLKQKGFCTSCIVFGVGSFTYQYLTRDTNGLAIKATYREEGDKSFNIFKDPKTDDGTKKSAKGLLKVLETDDGYELVDQVTMHEEMLDSCLETVYCDGIFRRTRGIDQIRQKVKDESYSW